MLIGDVDVSDGVWKRIKELNEGYITLKAEVQEACHFIGGAVHHDRPDSSDWVIRSQESRVLEAYRQPFSAEDVAKREAGSICISNTKYLRYNGELEVCRRGLEEDPRVNVIGHVCREDMNYLPYIKDGMGFRFEIL